MLCSPFIVNVALFFSFVPLALIAAAPIFTNPPQTRHESQRGSANPISHSYLKNTYNTIFKFDIGYRDDSLHWGQTFSQPLEDLISDIHWDGLSIFELSGLIKYESASHFYCRGSADYGTIFSGANRNKESVYIDGQTTPLANYQAAGRNGCVFDFSAGFGYAIKMGHTQQFCITPLAGYAYNVQLLHAKHAQELFNDDAEDCCPQKLPGLKSRYAARWNGPWLGADLSYKFSRVILLGTAEYHWAWYHGKAHWNLRTDFAHDPKQHSFGHGQLYSLGAKYATARHWLVGASLSYQTFKTHGGHSRLYFFSETAKLKLNSVHWKSFSVLFNITYNL